MICDALEQVRRKGLERIYCHMPDSMKCDYDNLTCERKVAFLLSGLFVKCQIEWPDLYESIAVFVYEIYSHRKELYDGI